MTLTDLAVAAGLILAPTLPLAYSHPAGLEQVRDWWLRGLTLGAILLAPVWLAPIAAFYAWRWPQEREPWRWLPRIVAWVGIGLAWALLMRADPAIWPWVTRGWVAWAVWEVGVMTRRAWQRGRWRGFGQRATGHLGTPVMQAAGLALVAPFAPWWLWPVLGWGLWLAHSWAAFLAVGVGAAVYLVPWRS